MNIVLDIETIPSQDAAVKAAFIKESVDNFKAPSGLSKGQAAKELGMTDEKEIKFTSKDDMVAKWQKHFAPIKAEVYTGLVSPKIKSEDTFPASISATRTLSESR